MELNKENLKTLQKGDIIFSRDNIEYTFEALTGDIVVLMTEGLSGIHLSLPIRYLIEDGNLIKDKVEYYNGWECRSYEGENVWVYVSSSSEIIAPHNCFAVNLINVNQEGFLSKGYHSIWQYAVQLTEINTKPMKIK